MDVQSSTQLPSVLLLLIPKARSWMYYPVPYCLLSHSILLWKLWHGCIIQCQAVFYYLKILDVKSSVSLSLLPVSGVWKYNHIAGCLLSPSFLNLKLEHGCVIQCPAVFCLPLFLKSEAKAWRCNPVPSCL